MIAMVNKYKKTKTKQQVQERKHETYVLSIIIPHHMRNRYLGVRVKDQKEGGKLGIVLAIPLFFNPESEKPIKYPLLN